MCITLPKWVIDQLEWQKGDELTLVTDVKQGKITLFKDKDAQDKPAPKTGDKPDEETDTGNGNDELQPIPKLRW
jgi:hypothetical protein